MPKTDDIPRGQLSTIILKTLLDNDKYGYEIINDVAEQTNGKIAIKQPSLYSCLRRMEEQSLISSYWRDSSLGGRRHYYRITDYGKKYVEKWQGDILTPSQSEDDKQASSESKDKPVFLEQENLFQQPQKAEQQKNSEVVSPVDNSFVQYDLFTQSNFIAKPSVEVFETLKDKQHENIVEESLPKDSIEDRISKLRNTILEENQNTANDFEPINVKQEFLLLKKKQKSFTESYKEDIIADDGKILDSEYELKLKQPYIKEQSPISESVNFGNDFDVSNNEDIQQQLTKTEVNENNQDFEHAKALINIEELKLSDDTENLIVEETQPPVFVDLDEDAPTIFKSTTEYKDEEELKNVNVETSYSLDLKEHTDSFNNFETTKTEDTELKIKEENSAVEKKIISNDDGVFITEKTDPEKAPKVKRIAPNRFEHFNNYNQTDNIITKLYEKKQEQNAYQEQQLVQDEVEVIEEENLSNEVIENNNVVNYTNFEQLALYYKQNGINFSSYKKLPKALKPQSSTYVKANKFNMLTSLSVLFMVLLQTIIVGIICSPKQPSLWFIYLFPPIISAIISVYYLSMFVKNKTKLIAKSSLKDYNFVINIIISFISILMIFSFNLIFGMSYNNILDYSTSFIYLCVLTLNLPLFSLAKYIILHSKFADA